jgi:hypothetical protein
VGRQRAAHALRPDGAPAQRQHPAARPVEELQHDLLLARAEGRLALAVEERLDRLAQPLLELPVGVERLHPELLRRRARR